MWLFEKATAGWTLLFISTKGVYTGFGDFPFAKQVPLLQWSSDCHTYLCVIEERKDQPSIGNIMKKESPHASL